MSFIFTTNPPKNWNIICEKENNSFNSTSWQIILNKGLNSQTLYGWDSVQEKGLTITVFKAACFRIGYIGFPISTTLGNGFLTHDDILSIRNVKLPIIVHQLRFSCGAFKEKFDNKSLYKEKKIPETAILDLRNWDISKAYKLKRNIKKATKFEVRGLNSDDNIKITAKNFFDLYKNTIIKNKGNLRYNSSYFNELIKSSLISKNIKCFIIDSNHIIHGFIFVICHNEDAYYLHSSISDTVKKNGGASKLFIESIYWAQKKHMKTFNFMASPSEQISLIQYKEKWGGETQIQYNFQTDVNPFMSKSFEYLINIYNILI